MEVIPGRLAGQPGERGSRVAALSGQHALGGLDRLLVRLSGGVLPRPRLVPDHDVAGSGAREALAQPR